MNTFTYNCSMDYTCWVSVDSICSVDYLRQLSIVLGAQRAAKELMEELPGETDDSCGWFHNNIACPKKASPEVVEYIREHNDSICPRC